MLDLVQGKAGQIFLKEIHNTLVNKIKPAAAVFISADFLKSERVLGGKWFLFVLVLFFLAF